MAKFTKKYSIDELRSIFARENCELLSSDYKNMLVPVDYKCSCGRDSKIAVFAFLKGSRCKECGRVKNSNSHKLRLSDVFNTFEAAGYSVISKEYINNKNPIEWICPNGHKGKTAYNNFKKGNRCKKCFVEKMVGKGNPRYDPDREAVADRLKFRRLCKNMVHQTLQLIGVRKCKRTKELLGYTPQQLKEHLNIGDKTDWSIDHIFPIKAFLDYGIEDLSVINALDNLRAITLEDNLKKNDKYDKCEFERYLTSKGIIWK